MCSTRNDWVELERFGESGHGQGVYILARGTGRKAWHASQSGRVPVKRAKTPPEDRRRRLHLFIVGLFVLLLHVLLGPCSIPPAASTIPCCVSRRRRRRHSFIASSTFTFHACCERAIAFLYIPYVDSISKSRRNNHGSPVSLHFSCRDAPLSSTRVSPELKQ